MLTIGREQLTAMLRHEPTLVAAIRRCVHADYAFIVEGLPDDLLDAMIGHGLRAARSFGLSQPGDLAGFVFVMFEVGPEFYRHPRIRAVLQDPGVPPERKLTAAFERTDEQVWDEVVSVLHRQTWFPELRETDY